MFLFKQFKRYYSSKKLLFIDIKMMRLLDIAENGVDAEGDAFIRLKSGGVFFSYLPNDKERNLYRSHKSSLPSALKEDCFHAALDVIQRFYRENCLIPIPQKSDHLYPGWGFIDIGAFIGYSVVKAAKKVSNAGRVIAVEANVESYRLLVKNVKENGLNNVTCVFAAAQDREGDIELFTGSRQQNSIHRNLQDQISGGETHYAKSEKVPGKTIDAIIKEANYPFEEMNTYVSIDINGAEPQALLGMTDFLNKCPRYDMDVAARYGGAGTEQSKTQIMKILSGYPGILIREIEPYIIACKYS